ncbi:MAG: 1-deoxy-D-xylulose-5-phosphate synthase [bacterium]|nr:1-deoxy-D-xylulose-5-phosphate synthase [bacterium]
MEYKYLSHINSPQDLKSLSIKELKELAHEIREEIIHTVSKTGGHLAPSLGVVELTLALHKVFDTPNDKIIWDVGHQTYAHKLITGRREQFHTLRTYGGISGFPRIEESEYDAFGTGHSSTSISAALGIVTARDLKGDKFKVIAVVGDGAMTAGMAYEGLNQTGFMRKDMIVVLNDNGMSISENVGGLARYLNKIIMTPAYAHLKADVWDLLGKLPKDLSERARVAARKLKEGLKSFIVPTILFEELGFEYIGPLNGHDIRTLIENFEYVKKIKGPVFVHVITEKGRGYEPAVNNPSKFHGLGSFDEVSGEVVENTLTPTYTDVFSDTIVELASNDSRIVAITAAMPDGTGLNKFRSTFPDRFFDVGIAEQHAITFSASLALQGLRPVCAIYSTFLQRGFDQLIHDICLQCIPVIFVLDRAGIVGEDGPTHHGTFDLSYLRCMPNIVISAPKDEDELRCMLYTAIKYKNGPIAIRYPKGSAFGVKLGAMRELKIGEAEVLKEGKDGVILAIGSMVYPSLQAAKELEDEKLSIGVINTRFVKPLDENLLKSVKNHKIITIEENVLNGGFGSAVLEFFNSQGIRPQLLRIGLPDQFIEHGARKILLEKYGLVSAKISQRVKEFLQK